MLFRSCGVAHHLGLDVHDCAQARYESYQGAAIRPPARAFPGPPCGVPGVSGISLGFPRLSRRRGQVGHVLLTRSPLYARPKASYSFDLHVLGAPPAFILSQDQTLRGKPRA